VAKVLGKWEKGVNILRWGNPKNRKPFLFVIFLPSAARKKKYSKGTGVHIRAMFLKELC